jgi:hypothetical protein
VPQLLVGRHRLVDAGAGLGLGGDGAVALVQAVGVDDDDLAERALAGVGLGGDLLDPGPVDSDVDRRDLELLEPGVEVAARVLVRGEGALAVVLGGGDLPRPAWVVARASRAARASMAGSRTGGAGARSVGAGAVGLSAVRSSTRLRAADWAWARTRCCSASRPASPVGGPRAGGARSSCSTTWWRSRSSSPSGGATRSGTGPSGRDTTGATSPGGPRAKGWVPGAMPTWGHGATS